MRVAARNQVRRAPTLLFALAMLLLMASRLLGQSSSSPLGANAKPEASCTVEEIAHEWLRVDGKVLYVEPFMAESNARGDVFLAGRYNLLGEIDSLNHWKPLGSDGDVIGAYLPHGAPPRLVRSPFPGKRLSGFRAVPTGDSSWTVVFGEVMTNPDGTYADSTRTLWSANLEGTFWSEMERLPSPPAHVLQHNLSALVQQGDTLSWAVMRASHLGVLVYQRARGRWSFSELPGFPDAIALSSSNGLMLATVAPDTTQPNGGGSLLLWRRDPTWRRSGVSVQGRREKVYEPAFSRRGAGQMVTWQTSPHDLPAWAWRVRSMWMADTATTGRAFTVDTLSSGMSPPAPFRLSDGTTLWITDHRVSRDSAEIQFATFDEAAGHSVVIGRTPHHFPTPFAAVGLGHGDVLVSGSFYQPSQYLVTDLLRFHVRCPAAEAPVPPHSRRHTTLAPTKFE